jgi:uncharacterized protein (TIGR01319 family)
MEGFNNAYAKLTAQIGEFKYDDMLCCSSAGGGLKMVALGLVPALTSKAAKMAASSAGAKVVKTYAYEISDEEMQEIYDINPDLVLLCGGTDGGNKEVIVSNARLLAGIKRDFSIIVAGNKTASREIEAILKDSDKDFVITKNVMPRLNELDIEPARDSIKNLFIQKIIVAKGLSNAQAMTKHEIVPTPFAVLQGCELFSLGTRTTPGVGEFMAIDIGGATTDVYSMSKGDPTVSNVVIKGLPEPYSKRTVEGDLGMRYSVGHLLDEADVYNVSQKIDVSEDEIRSWVSKCVKDPELVAAAGTRERKIDEGLANFAVRLAGKRHCGTMVSVYTPTGELFALTGKDLGETKYVIGIGGVIVNSEHPAQILEGMKYDISDYSYMLPKKPEYMWDKKYIFSSMGLLSEIDPELALAILKKEIKLID